MSTANLTQKNRNRPYNLKVVIDGQLKEKLRRIAFYRDESYTEIVGRLLEKEFIVTSKVWQKSVDRGNLLPEQES
jgi:hypothetical protein